jgi:acyl CoA:acetate/3-ketoacid CoA transferase beta subunit
MIQWLTDNYVVQAGDAAAAYAGRCYNAGKGQWETVSGGSPSSSAIKQHYLRSADIRVQLTGGQIKRGIYIQLWIIGDGLHTDLVVPWHEGVQGAAQMVSWQGRVPMLAGFQWRIHTGGAGGLIAGDRVGIGVSYE